MVATALARRAIWSILALAAAGFIGFVAMRGERPEAGLQRFEPAGFLAGHEPQDVRSVIVAAAGRQWRYQRSPRGEWSTGGSATAITPDQVQRIEQALDLLRNAKPERQFTPEEAAGMRAADMGLEPPVMVVSVLETDGTRFTIAFGAENPLGHARYARIEGRDTLWLVPRHAADAWDIVARQP